MNNILITGATSGIGQACAEASAKSGRKVYASYRQDKDYEKLKSIHSNLIPLKIEMTNLEDQRKAFEYIKKQDGKLDALFNNAGVSASGVAEFQSLDLFRQQFEINFLSAVSMTQIFLPLIRKSNDPRIIFTGSAAGILAKPMMASYSASKFALKSFVDTIRLELSPWNINVSILEPGKIKTEIYKKSLEDFQVAQEKRSPEEKQLYQDLIKVAEYNILTADEHSDPVHVIVNAFMHALESKEPRYRYPIGGDAKFQFIIGKIFPERWRDHLIKLKIKNILKKVKNV